ncbi:MAG TPA: hydroxymethylbilane synthase, partial [Luteolibacter sp.]
LQKLAAGEEYDAILLAEAGLIRLGFLPDESVAETNERIHSEDGSLDALFATRLPEHVFYPAAGQGAIGFEIRANDAAARVRAEAIGHRETWLRLTAEREFLRLLEGGCHTPVGVYSRITGDTIHLHARVFPETGGKPRVAEIAAAAADPLSAASLLFHSLA